MLRRFESLKHRTIHKMVDLGFKSCLILVQIIFVVPLFIQKFFVE